MSAELTAVQSYTHEQVELIKRTVAKGATDDELSMFMAVARRARLDPFTKQIHFVKRKQKDANGNWVEVGAIQISIDGYRAIAERTGTLAGIDDAIFDSEDRPNPKKATVSVYRLVDGMRVPFTASARWSEYAATYKDGNPQPMWKKMPYLMLGKCAEALALRKAFPNDLSGLYTNEEMQQADIEAQPLVEHVSQRRNEALPPPQEAAAVTVVVDLPTYMSRIAQCQDINLLRGIYKTGMAEAAAAGDMVARAKIRDAGIERAAMIEDAGIERAAMIEEMAEIQSAEMDIAFKETVTEDGEVVSQDDRGGV